MSETKVAFFLFISAFLFTPSVAVVRQERFKRGFLEKTKGKVLTGHVISSHHVVSPIDCSFLCTSTAQCSSYNYKPKGAGDKDICELNNATRKSNPESYQNDALYIHYYDGQVENSKSCLDYLRSGLTQNGIYNITDRSGITYKVWCDLSSEPGSAWTLILSYAHKKRDKERFCSIPYTEDKPANKNDPNWESYRQSLSRMQDISGQSTHVRVTSSFPVYGVDYRDYLRAKISSLDILSFTGDGVCKTVEYIDVRGIKGKDITVPFWQKTAEFLHTDSSYSPCQYNPTSGSVHSENNFGRTCDTSNPATRVISSCTGILQGLLFKCKFSVCKLTR